VAAGCPVALNAAWNGTRAAVVPWGLDGSGLPLSIQLVGRPFDEATLLSLAAEIEADRPWAQRRPSVS
jgi:amidase